MSVRGWGHLFVQGTAPSEAPVMLGSLWSDTATAALKLCTAISPYTFAAVGGGGSGSPGGSDTQVQFNDSGSFGGNAGFTFDKVTGALTLTPSSQNALVIVPDAADGANFGITLHDNPNGFGSRPNQVIAFGYNPEGQTEGEQNIEWNFESYYRPTSGPPMQEAHFLFGGVRLMTGSFEIGNPGSERWTFNSNNLFRFRDGSLNEYMTIGPDGIALTALPGHTPLFIGDVQGTVGSANGLDSLHTATETYINVWDTDDAMNRVFATLTPGATPKFTLAVPAGGTLDVGASTLTNTQTAYLATAASSGKAFTVGGSVQFETYLDSSGVFIGALTNHKLGLFTNDGDAQLLIGTTGSLPGTITMPLGQSFGFSSNANPASGSLDTGFQRVSAGVLKSVTGVGGTVGTFRSHFQGATGTAGVTAGPFTVITAIQVEDGIVTLLTGS